jgi:hypothetical protein
VFIVVVVVVVYVVINSVRKLLNTPSYRAVIYELNTIKEIQWATECTEHTGSERSGRAGEQFMLLFCVHFIKFVNKNKACNSLQNE